MRTENECKNKVDRVVGHLNIVCSFIIKMSRNFKQEMHKLSREPNNKDISFQISIKGFLFINKIEFIDNIA